MVLASGSVESGGLRGDGVDFMASWLSFAMVVQICDLRR